MNEKYKDMLRLPHPVSATHPRMSLQDRAAQFSPFAALTGYEDALKEMARLTDHFVELDEDRKQEIDRQIGYLQQHMREELTVKITYFVPDTRKTVVPTTLWKDACKKLTKIAKASGYRERRYW